MKIKHLFLPIYTLLMLLALMVVYYKPNTDKLTLFATIFLTANISVLLVYFFTLVEVNWSRKIKDFI